MYCVGQLSHFLSLSECLAVFLRSVLLGRVLPFDSNLCLATPPDHNVYAWHCFANAEVARLNTCLDISGSTLCVCARVCVCVSTGTRPHARSARAFMRKRAMRAHVRRVAVEHSCQEHLAIRRGDADTGKEQLFEPDAPRFKHRRAVFYERWRRPMLCVMCRVWSMLSWCQKL